MTSNDIFFKLIRSDDLSVRDKAIEDLYIQCYPTIKRYIADNNGNAKDAEDVFQDALVVFYQKARNPDFDLNCTILTFIYSISKNLWLNKLKVNSRYSPLDDKIGFLPISDYTLSLADKDERYTEVKIQFAKMNEKCKKILYNFYFHRMSMFAIAEEYGFANEQVAKNTKSRCLRKLKVLMSNSKANSK